MQIFDLKLGFSKILCILLYNRLFVRWFGNMRWGGKVQEGGDISVYIAVHVIIWQKPTQYCKAVILQLKERQKKNQLGAPW